MDMILQVHESLLEQLKIADLGAVVKNWEDTYRHLNYFRLDINDKNDGIVWTGTWCLTDIELDDMSRMVNCEESVNRVLTGFLAARLGTNNMMLGAGP